MTQTQQDPTRIVVFEQQGSGQFKIKGIREFGRNIVITAIFNLNVSLPPFVDEPEHYITDRFTADLVLDFFKHPDLSHYLASLCTRKGIPVVASGKKIPGAITPFTCCGLGRNKRLAAYGEQFGLPELNIAVADGRVVRIEVRRGAPCGVTWRVVPRIIGRPVEEASYTMAREVQYLCAADPSKFDPLSGKSSLHYAGDVHAAAVNKALKNADAQC
jgi:hypothetical protein